MNRTSSLRRGFSIIEVSVTSFLLVLLSMLISSAWHSLGRPLLDTTYRCRVAQEASLAQACLARDFGGSLVDGDAKLGKKSTNRLVGRTQPAGNELWLCYDGGATPNGVADWLSPDTVVSYRVVDNTLIRYNALSGNEFIVAKYVDSLTATDHADEVEIRLTFAYHGISQSYLLVAKDP